MANNVTVDEWFQVTTGVSGTNNNWLLTLEPPTFQYT